MDCSPPGSSVHGIFQARIMEWVAELLSQGALVPAVLWGEPALCAHILSLFSLPPLPIPSLQVIMEPTPSSVLWRNSVRAGWHVIVLCVQSPRCRRAPASLSRLCARVPALSTADTRSLRHPRGRRGKGSACQRRRCGLAPRVGKRPWRRKRQPSLVLWPGEPPVWGSGLENPQSGPLAWRTPSLGLWPGEPHGQRQPGRPQSMGLERVRCDWVHTYMKPNLSAGVEMETETHFLYIK